jgi:Phage integrase, N-terminal SAM-like domain
MPSSAMKRPKSLGSCWIKYHIKGRPVCVSSESERKADAQRLLRQREHLVDTGAPATVHAAKVTFEDAAADLINDYVTNRRRSLPTVRIRVAKHLTPYFRHRRLASITTADTRAYTAHRQAAGVSNATINRELVLLKHMCTLATQAGKLMVRRTGAGCPGRIPHDFRRTAVRNLVRAGVTERVAMQLTGHKTRSVFERYNIVSPGELRDAAQRLDGFASTR